MTREWFTERVGSKIIRTNTYDNTETEWEVTEQNAGYLWLFTEKGYTFRDSAVIAHTAITVSEMENATVDNDDWLEAAKPVLRIHKTLQACESCQG